MFFKEKEEVLQKYKKITFNLSQESALRSKIKSLQGLLENKQKLTKDLQNTVVKTTKETENLKKFLNQSETAQFLHKKKELESELSKIIENQKKISDELSNTNKETEIEKQTNSITPEIGNKAIKKKILSTEIEISEVLKEIKIKEKEKDNARVSYQKIFAEKKKNRAFSNQNCKSAIITPKNVSNTEIDKLPSPMNKNVPNRDRLVKNLRKGLNDFDSSKFFKILTKFGSNEQSMTSKIILLNRGELK